MASNYVIRPITINMNTHYYIIRAKVGDDTIPIGILKIPPTDDLQHAVRYCIDNLRFRRNNRAVMLAYLWEEEITEPEYSTYLEMKILQNIAFDYNFVSDCGLYIYSKDEYTGSDTTTGKFIMAKDKTNRYYKISAKCSLK